MISLFLLFSQPLTFPCTTLSLTFCQSPLLMASKTSTPLRRKMFIAAAAVMHCCCT